MSQQGRGALFVALGIFCSRLLGLLRERVFAHYFGNSFASDAYRAASRIPNLLQNLLGEGVLSASFIPRYSLLLAQGKNSEARRLSLIIFRMLAGVSILVSALGVLATPFLVDLIAPGFSGETRELAIQLTRVFFPATSLLVLSAWCLGILNSHKNFFLPYFAPVVWNLIMILTLVFFGANSNGASLAQMAAWGAVIGGACQFLVQLPKVLALLSQLKSDLPADEEEVKRSSRKVLKDLLPVVFGRGVVQISAYADSMIASLVGAGALSCLSFAQTIYLLPVSLFGMSVSAAELPGMSQLRGSIDEHEKIALRLISGLRQIAFFVIPTAVCFIGLGHELIGAVFQTGQFRAQDTFLVWSLLAALAFGLLPTTLSRLLSSTFYALHDTKTPVRIAVIRVGVSITFSLALALLPQQFYSSEQAPLVLLGLLGLGAGSALGANTEFLLLWKKISKRLPLTVEYSTPGLKRTYFLTLLLASLLGVLVAHGIKELALALLHASPYAPGALLQGVFTLAVFGISYLGFCLMKQIPEAHQLLLRIKRRSAAASQG